MRVIEVQTGWTPKKDCDGLKVVVLVVVLSEQAVSLSLRGECVVKGVKPLSSSSVICSEELVSKEWLNLTDAELEVVDFEFFFI